jgi:hypothetical protein
VLRAQPVFQRAASAAATVSVLRSGWLAQRAAVRALRTAAATQQGEPAPADAEAAADVSPVEEKEHCIVSRVSVALQLHIRVAFGCQSCAVGASMRQPHLQLAALPTAGERSTLFLPFLLLQVNFYHLVDIQRPYEVRAMPGFASQC